MNIPSDDSSMIVTCKKENVERPSKCLRLDQDNKIEFENKFLTNEIKKGSLFLKINFQFKISNYYFQIQAYSTRILNIHK